MAEGWACYATDLMGEAGFLTPLEGLAEVHSRIRMCARAIVDSAIHRERMNLEEAVQFYQEQAGMTEAAARGEAVKNSMFPATGLMYLMGTDGIRRIRQELRELLRSNFSLQRFHDCLLAYGSLPVALIREEMIRFAESHGTL